MATVEHQHGSYTISDDPSRLDANAIWDFMDSSQGIPISSLERALANSLCIGAYGSAGNQVGLLRLITDFATFCFVTDLFVHVDHRYQGLSKVMIAAALSHPRLRAVPRWSVMAGDAHELFASAGFTTIARPGHHMERRRRVSHIEAETPKLNDKEFCLGYN
jgi:N-acetylglutamate synthase-like GNAT family acetyltransferase